MGKYVDALDDNMVGGDMALKAKMLEDRKKHIEKIPFIEKKEILEKHFKTNVEQILENGRIISSAERSEKDAIDRKCHRELKYEMEQYEWTLVKLLNGKRKAIIVKGCEEESIWSTEEQKFKTPKKIIAKKQAIVDSLEIRDGFTKVKWEHGIYTKEEYIKLREREDKFWKDKGGTGFKDLIPEEIAIVKLHLNPEKWNCHNLNNYYHGFLFDDEVKSNRDDKMIARW
jgi:hypothetical protein